MVESRAADEGGEAPCFAHLVDPESGRISDAVVGGPGDAGDAGSAAGGREAARGRADRDARRGDGG
ncbi:MAG TPA: hypothetical protein VFZ77_24105 [Acidimicrobiales bacterium]